MRSTSGVDAGPGSVDDDCCGGAVSLSLEAATGADIGTPYLSFL